MPIGCWRYVGLFSLICVALFLTSMFDGFIATLHILPLISITGLNSKVRDMTFAEVSDVSRLFRIPDCKSWPTLTVCC